MGSAACGTHELRSTSRASSADSARLNRRSSETRPISRGSPVAPVERMDPHLQALLDRAANPRLVPGIYNYCHRRCARCPFTERCLSFIDNREREARDPEKGMLEHVEASLIDTVDLMRAWCEREGLDFEAIRRDAASAETAAAIEREQQAVDADPLHR